MDNSMLMDRRVRRASAAVLLAAYIVILIAGFVGMLWTDPPDHYQSYSEWITAVETTEQDPFPTAGIIRYIYNIEGLCTVNVSAEPFSISGDESEQESEGDDARTTAEERLIAYFGYTPTPDEIDLFYQTVQAECGYNGVSDEFIRIFLCKQL